MATSEVIKLNNVRLSFPRLFEAKAFREGQTPRFEGTFLLDPSNKAHAKSIKLIEKTAAEIGKEKWGKKLPKKLEFCFGDAEENDKTYDGYEGMFYISTSQPATQGRPTIVDRDRSALTAEDGRPYAGCYVNTNITLWTQDNEFGKRINANLRIVQFVKDGEAFGVKPADAEEEMDVIDDDEGLNDDDPELDDDDDL
jgi:hypothetical protein